MAGSLVQWKGAGASAPGATLSATLDSTPTDGNVLVCMVSSDTTMTAGPSGWTERVAYVSNQGFYVYTKVASSTGATVTVDPNGDNETAMLVAEFSGVSAYEAISSTAATQSSPGQTSRTTNAVTPAGNAVYMACYGLHGFNTDAPASPSYTGSFTGIGSAVSATGSANTRAGVLAAWLSGTGSQNPTASWTNGVTNTAAVVVAITEAATVVLPPLHAALPNIAAIVSAHY